MKMKAAVLEEIGSVEARLAEINAAYCAPGFFERTPLGEVEGLQKERARLESELASLTEQWESLELEIAALE